MGGYAFIKLMVFLGELLTLDEKYVIIPIEKIYKKAINIELLDFKILTGETIYAIEHHESSRPTVNLTSEFLQNLRLKQTTKPTFISELWTTLPGAPPTVWWRSVAREKPQAARCRLPTRSHASPQSAVRLKHQQNKSRIPMDVPISPFSRRQKPQTPDFL